MGANESKQLGTQVQESPKINHEKFAARRIFAAQDGTETIQISVSVPSEKDYKGWREQADRLGQEESLLLPTASSYRKEGFCGSAGTVELIFENYPFLLSDEIHNRECLDGKYFEENELWYLALTLLTAAHYFHSRGSKVGDIRPHNVFISEDGSVKVACLHSWPLETTNYEKAFEKVLTYLSPEEIKDLAYGRTEPSSDFGLSETFSIGLTLLDAATLTNSADLYKEIKKLDYQNLEARLEELSDQSYSPLLKQTIENMCQLNTENRTTAEELYQWLIPHEEAINNFEQFSPQSLPPKFAPTQPAPRLNAPNHYNAYLSTSPTPTPPSNFSNNPSSIAPPPAYPPPAYPPPSQTAFSTNIQTNYTTTPVEFKTGMFSYTSTPPITMPATYVGSGFVQSTYVPYNSKFSLEKIDQQLEQSRKWFPS